MRNGNELADQLVTAAHKLQLHYKGVSISDSFIKKELRHGLLDNWQYQWDCGTTGREAYDLLPNMQIHHYHFPAHMVRLISGHGPFPTYMFKIRMVGNPGGACGDTEDLGHSVARSTPLKFLHS